MLFGFNKEINLYNMKYPLHATPTARRFRAPFQALFLGTLAVLLSLTTLSCEGPIGPEGPPGRDGLDGVNILGTVFEAQGTFSAANQYSLLFEFPNTLEVFETDVVLVYLLWDTTQDGNGQSVDIWRLLPQTRIIDQGLLQYNFDHTFFDVSVFLETDFDPAFLLPGDTDNQVFRIAVLPADPLNGSRVNLSDYEQVMQFMGATEKDIIRLDESRQAQTK